MNRKSVLQLIELLIMVLIFAIAACICIRCFVYADTLSREQENKTMAIQVAQNAAELLKANAGDLERAAANMGGYCEDGKWYVPMDDAWNVIPQLEHSAFLLTVTLHAETDLPMGTALVQVAQGEKTLVEFTVAWQEGM